MLKDQLAVNKKIPTEFFKENRQKFEFWEHSYECESDYLDSVDDRGNDILTRFSCESNADYKVRKANTPLKNYTKPILDQYNAAVFRNYPQRDINFPEYLTKDADGLGQGYDEILRKALLSAQIYGVSYLMPMSSVSNSEILTIAQRQQSGFRHFVRLIDVESVADINEVDDILLEAIVILTDENGEEFARYMDSTNYIDMRIDSKGTIKEISEPYAHGYSSIPLVKVAPDVSAESQAAPIAQSQKHIVNLHSLLNHEIVEQNFTRFLLSGIRLPEDDPEALEKLQLQWSSKRLMVVEDGGVGVHKLGADKSQADSIRESIKNELEEMYRNAGLSSANVDMSNTVASGVSLLVNRESFFLICNKLKNAIEVADNKLISLIAEVEGFNFIETIYSSDFMAKDMGEYILKLRDILALDIPKVIKNKMVEAFANEFFNLTDEEINILKEQLSV